MSRYSFFNAKTLYDSGIHSWSILWRALFSRSKQDFLSPAMLLLNILPITLGILFWCGILFYFSDSLISYFWSFLPDSWHLNIENANSWTENFIVLLLYLLLGFVAILFALIGNLFVSIFYTPIVVAYIRKRHYPNIQKYEGATLWLGLKNFFIAFVMLCALCVVCAPILFVPFVGGAIFFFFFYKTMFFDVGYEVLGKEHYATLRMFKHKYKTALIAYGFGLIPILNFFMPLLQTIIICHFCFLWLEHLQEPDSKMQTT